MDLFDELRDLLLDSEGTPAVSSFIPEGKGEEDRISYIVTGYRLDKLPGQVVLMSKLQNIWPVSESRWEKEFHKVADLKNSVVTPA